MEILRAISARVRLALYSLERGDTKRAVSILSMLVRILPYPGDHNVEAANNGGQLDKG
jgi:hypothetical protein